MLQERQLIELGITEDRSGVQIIDPSANTQSKLTKNLIDMYKNHSLIVRIYLEENSLKPENLSLVV